MQPFPALAKFIFALFFGRTSFPAPGALRHPCSTLYHFNEHRTRRLCESQFLPLRKLHQFLLLYSCARWPRFGHRKAGKERGTPRHWHKLHSTCRRGATTSTFNTIRPQHRIFHPCTDRHLTARSRMIPNHAQHPARCRRCAPRSTSYSARSSVTLSGHFAEFRRVVP